MYLEDDEQEIIQDREKDYESINEKSSLIKYLENHFQFPLHDTTSAS